FAPVVLPDNANTLVAGGLSPTMDWAELQRHGAKVRPVATHAAAQHPDTPEANGWRQYKLGVVDLLDEPRNLAEYRLGTPNFFAITHYRRGYVYATAVADLARALSDRMGYGGPDWTDLVEYAGRQIAVPAVAY